MPELTEEQRKELEEKIKRMSPEELREFQKQQCIFCQIITGKIPSKKIYEDETAIAVLDINPASKGHLLILPKEHYAIMPQIPEKEMGHLFLVVRALSQVLLRTLKVSGTSLFIANGPAAGQKAQHFMIHLIPRKEQDQILNVEEKLLGEGMTLKVKAVIEKKLSELLGIKKETVKPLPEFVKITAAKEENPREKVIIEEANRSESTNESTKESEPPLEEKQAVKEVKKRARKNKVNEERESENTTKRGEENNVSESKEEISLDDIAKLFR